MFTKEVISDLQKRSVLVSQAVDAEAVYLLNRPARLTFSEEITDKIRANYKIDEEIGGILWVGTGERQSGTENILNVTKISFIRNAVEDQPRTDHRNKANAYLRDSDEFSIAYSKCINEGFLPLRFHTHPTDGADFSEQLEHTMNNWETSNADIKEAQGFEHSETGIKVILPRVLIVGHGDMVLREFFYGVYGGMVAPEGFNKSKDQVQHQQIESFFNKAKDISFTKTETTLIIAGFIGLILLAIKYRKTSIPILFALAMVGTAFLTNTDAIESPQYFNKTRQGRVEISIP